VRSDRSHGELLVEAAQQDERYYQSHAWPMALGLAAAAGAAEALGRTELRERPRAVTDQATGQALVLRTEHTIFFLNARF
jgi:hypothetical protein